MRILFIGDIVGSGGREAVNRFVPELRTEYSCEFCVANGENMANGNGFARSTLDELKKSQVDVPLTYADYQSDVKPKPQKPDEKKKIKGWKCKICGYYYEGEKLPDGYHCPTCGHDSDDFEPVYE